MKLDKPALLRHIIAASKIAWFRLGGSQSGGRGHYTYSCQYIEEILANEAMLDAFRRNSLLPQGFGKSLSERCIEYPWVLSRIYSGDNKILDAGSALNFSFLVKGRQLAGKSITCVTLAPERECFYREGVGYLFEDLRNLPLRDNAYDVVVSISTVEHIGLDNSIYTNKKQFHESLGNSFELALMEFRRVLKLGGRLLLTVPYGKPHALAWQRNFDEGLLQRAMSAFGLSLTEQAFYRYTNEGWLCDTAERCADAVYNECWAPRFFSAGAVACLYMTKSE
jgi:SAM-dependent methyltransferase